MPRSRTLLRPFPALAFLAAALLAPAAWPAAPATAPDRAAAKEKARIEAEHASAKEKEKEEDAAYRTLVAATSAVVHVKTRALGNARSNENLGSERTGSGVLIAPSGLVLTIGYLILEADRIDLVNRQACRRARCNARQDEVADGIHLQPPTGLDHRCRYRVDDEQRSIAFKT